MELKNASSAIEKDLEMGTATTTRTLWARLQEMEEEMRFGGRPYPKGRCPFPFKLTGQGFFPGGDGLWRDDAELDRQSSGTLPLGGVVFLGNDFGTLKTYQKLQFKGFENPPTWRRLKERIRRAKVPERQAFFTNSIVGLLSADGDKALHKKPLQSEPAFEAFCREFFVYQIEILQPRLLVVMGQAARRSLGTWGVVATDAGVTPARVKIGHYTTALRYVTHPFADFKFTEARKTDDALALQNAWEGSAFVER